MGYRATGAPKDRDYVIRVAGVGERMCSRVLDVFKSI